MQKNQDSVLLKELKNGNQKAFDALFLKYYKLLVSNAYFYLKCEEEAQDLVQEFLFEFWDKRLYLKLDGDIKGYLYRAIQNRCINFHRKHHRQKEKVGISMHDIPDISENFETLEEHFSRLQTAIDDLSPQRKEALQRVFLEEKKYQEAADEMGVSLNTLKTHLKIGLKNLREKLLNR